MVVRISACRKSSCCILRSTPNKPSSSATSIYAYDGNNLVEETNSTRGVVARYEQTQNIDDPLVMLCSSATSFHADGLGSVTSLTMLHGKLAALSIRQRQIGIELGERFGHVAATEAEADMVGLIVNGAG
jgi:hypothetical protein